MKKIYTLFGVCLIAGSVFSQSNLVDPSSYAKSPFQPDFEQADHEMLPVLIPDNEVPTPTPVGSPEAFNTIWSSDFDTPSQWLSTSSPTAPGAAPWAIVDAGTATISWFANPIASSSGDNMAYMDPNGLTGTTQYDILLTTSASIDISNETPNVALTFEQYYARFNEDTRIEISSNGTSWTEVGSNKHVEITALGTGQFPTDNPDLRCYDLRDALTAMGSPTDIWIRFGYNGNVGYGWMLDDVQLIETPQNNMTLVESYFNQYADSSETKTYTLIPERQADGLLWDFGGAYENQGTLTQTNARLEVNITEPTGTQSFSSPSAVALITTVADSTNATSGTYSPAEGTGNYSVEFTMMTDSMPDVASGRNTKVHEFEVTNTKYSRDKGFSGGGSSFSNSIGAYQMSVRYEFPTADSVIGMCIEFFDNSASGNGTTVGAFFDVVFGTAPDALTPHQQFVEVLSTDLNAEKIIMFDTPYEVLTPGDIFAGFRVLNGSDDFWLNVNTIDDDLNCTPPFITYVGNNDNSNIGYSDVTPFIRLITKPKASLCAAANITINENVTYDLAAYTANITAIAVGGTGTFSYQWNDSANSTTNSILVNALQTYTVTVTDGNFCTATKNIQVTGGNVSVSELQNDAFSFKVFPNPSGGEFTLDIDNASNGAYTIDVKNMLGQTVHNEVISVNGNTTKVLNLSGMDKGVYFLHLSNSGAEKSERVVIR